MRKTTTKQKQKKKKTGRNRQIMSEQKKTKNVVQKCN